MNSSLRRTFSAGRRSAVSTESISRERRSIFAGGTGTCRASAGPSTLASALLALWLLSAGRLSAQTNGVWSQTTPGGLWSNSGDWLGGTIASGTGATADFSQLLLPGNNTVLLDEAPPFFIGNLIFGDRGGTYNWTLGNSGSGGALTLATSSGTPTITMDNDSATIGVVLAGTQGLAVTGPGATLVGPARSIYGSLAR